MTSNEQRAFLETLHETQTWFGQSPHAGRTVRHFALGAVYLHGWRLHRLWRNQTPPPSTGIIVRAGDKLDEITSAASVLLWECSGLNPAHEQVLTVLGEVQSNSVKRNHQREIGDVLFTLADTMFLFARANLVVLIRNAGPQVLSLGEIASTIDFAILRHLQKSEPSRLVQ